MALTGKARGVAVLLASFLMLLWPLIVNGGPFIMADTTAYVRGADAGIYQVMGIETPWTKEFTAKFENRLGRRSSPEAADVGSPAEKPIVLAGRSIYYGLFLYVSSILGSFWFMAIAQAALVFACVYLTAVQFQPLERTSPVALGIMLAIIAAISPIGYFAAYMMPDIFSGLAILAFANILFFCSSMSRKLAVFWTAVLALALLFHSSNILIILVLTVLAAAASFRMSGFEFKSVKLVGIALLIGAVGEMGFSGAVKELTGSAPVRPPFMTARLIADGPGLDYLQETCPGSGFFVCRFVDNLPRYSDNFLWSDKRPEGLFSTLPNAERRALAAEQGRFVFAVFADRPGAVLVSSARAVLEQARQTGLSEFNYFPEHVAGFREKLPRPVYDELSTSAAFHRAMPVGWIVALTPWVIVASLIGIGWSLTSRKPDGRVAGFAVFILAGVLVDIMVCGAISTPHDRYLMRVIWLLPLLALVLLNMGWRRDPSPNR